MQTRLKRIERGNGITGSFALQWEKSSKDPLASNPAEAMERAFNEILQEIENYDWFDDIYDLACVVLEKAGLPTKWGFYKQVGTQWEERGPEDPSSMPADLIAMLACFTYFPEAGPGSYQDLRRITAERFGEDSDEDFCARLVLMLDTFGRLEREAYRPFRERLCMMIGKTFSAWYFKGEHERDALDGERSRENLAAGRRSAAQAKRQKTRTWKTRAREMAKDVWRKNPSHKVSAVAAIIRPKLEAEELDGLPKFGRENRALRDAIADLDPKRLESSS
jgi:hypothetical protein